MGKTLLFALAILGCGGLAGVVLGGVHPSRAEALTSQAGAIAVTDAAQHVGQSVTVEGVVSEVHIARYATFLDMGGRYPDEAFTGVIFPDDYGAFPKATLLEGKTVDISGTVQLYQGRPEIILRSSSQITIE